MRFKDLSLGKKLGVGFGLLISITAAIGIIAVVNMNTIREGSANLSKEYVPAVNKSNDVERNALLTMYAMRGYGLSEEEQYLSEAQSRFDATSSHLKETEAIVRNNNNLKDLESKLIEAQAAMEEYKVLMDRTEQANHNLETYRNAMDENAAAFMDACYAFLDNQNKRFQTEINRGAGSRLSTERLKKITWINDIIDAGNTVRVANFKAQTLRDPDTYQQAINNFMIADELQNLRGTNCDQAGMLALADIEKAAAEYQDAMQEFLSQWLEREQLAQKREEVGTVILEDAQTIAETGTGGTQTVADDAMNRAQTASTVLLTGLFLAVLAGIVMAISLTRIITNPVKKGVEFASAIAKGDLTAKLEVDQKDEVGQLAQSLQEMVAKLKEVISGIISGSNNIAAASFQMSSTSQQMSQGASEQASSAEEVSSSMEEMSANIQQNTSNAQETEKISMVASDGIRKGNETSKKSVAAMNEIAEKITIINDIAFQTNILALNAAVEAARAGEHGKGFAVVAAEVRKLAERSAEAAGDIDIVSKNGVDISQKAGELLESIVPEIERTSNLVKEITASSMEQNTGADQVNTAIQQLSQVTQQNAAASEEMATSAEELSSQAEQLQELVSYFNIGYQFKQSKSSDKKNVKAKQKPVSSHSEQEPKNKMEPVVDLNMEETASEHNYEQY